MWGTRAKKMFAVFQAIEPYIKSRKTRCRLRATCKDASHVFEKPKSLRKLALKLRFYRVPTFERSPEMVDYMYKIASIARDYENIHWKLQETMHVLRVLLANPQHARYFRSTIRIAVNKMESCGYGSNRLVCRLKNVCV